MHFGQIPRVPGDPILGLMDLYRADPNPAKLDLGVGVYKDAQGLTPIPRAVKLAEQHLVDSEQTKSYIGGHGDAQFGALLLRQVLGSLFENAMRNIQPIRPSRQSQLRFVMVFIRHVSKIFRIDIRRIAQNDIVLANDVAEYV